MVTELNFGNGVGKQRVTGGGGGGGRKKKSSLLTQKKKEPQRGMGVAQLENMRKLEEQKSKNPPPLPPFPIENHQNFFPSSAALPTSISYATLSNGAVQLSPVSPAPATMVHGLGNGYGFHHGPPSKLFSLDHQFQIVDPSGIGSFNNVGFRVETSKELSSIPNYDKCASDGCGVCHKKKRINGDRNMYAEVFSSVNPFASFKGNSLNHKVLDMINAGNLPFAAKTRSSLELEPDVVAAYRSRTMVGGGGGSLSMVYDFFPEKGRGGGERGSEYRELMKMGWKGESSSSPSSSVAVGLRGGVGSCVTAVATGSDHGVEEGSSSVDLSLKLSY